MVRVEMMRKYNWYGNVEDARVAPACLIAAKARPARHVVHTGATYASCCCMGETHESQNKYAIFTKQFFTTVIFFKKL
jgi:hypothetical protein